MKRLLLLGCTLSLLTGSVLWRTGRATAQASLYELSQSWFGSGGATSGGSYALTLTIGDPVADEVSGGAYSLGGGFWGGGARIVAPVTPTPTFTTTALPSITATPTATATPSGIGLPTATATPPVIGLPTATATPTPPGETTVTRMLYLPLVER